jgi:hypothetical protein
MSVRAAFKELQRKLQDLHQVCQELHVTVAEDRPLNGGAAAADALEDRLTEIVAALDEAISAADKGAQSLTPPSDYEQARRALGTVHHCVNRVVRGFTVGPELTGQISTGLVTYDHIHSLQQLGHGRGREWRSWVGEVKTSVVRCVAPLAAACDAIEEAWQELTERIGTNLVSVQTTNVGQLVTWHEDESDSTGQVT